jgi:hypothetical protein
MHILWPFVVLIKHLVHFVVFGYIFPGFWHVVHTKNNLATLAGPFAVISVACKLTFINQSSAAAKTVKIARRWTFVTIKSYVRTKMKIVKRYRIHMYICHTIHTTTIPQYNTHNINHNTILIILTTIQYS